MSTMSSSPPAHGLPLRGPSSAPYVRLTSTTSGGGASCRPHFRVRRRGEGAGLYGRSDSKFAHAPKTLARGPRSASWARAIRPPSGVDGTPDSSGGGHAVQKRRHNSPRAPKVKNRQRPRRAHAGYPPVRRLSARNPANPGTSRDRRGGGSSGRAPPNRRRIAFSTM